LLALFYVAIRLIPIIAASQRSQAVAAKISQNMPWLDKDRRLIFGAPLVGFVAVPALWLISHVVLWALILLIVIPVVGIPLISGAHGQKRAHETVINPHQCRTLDALGRQQAPMRGARCVRLMKSGEEIQRGRYITEDEHRVWLLRKTPWAVVSVPLDDTLMEDVQVEVRPSASESRK
jgi:hypothetical protein